MARESSNITLHMVSSLDGFISGKNGDISWMESKDHYEKGVVLTEEFIAEFLASIDCYVMGSRTYELALKLGWPYGDTPVVVLTNRALKSDRETVEFYTGDLNELVNNRLRPNHEKIWVVGGSITAKAFIDAGLVNEVVMSVIPVIIGEGTPFFDHIGKEQRLLLKDVKAFRDGMVELRYEIEQE